MTTEHESAGPEPGEGTLMERDNAEGVLRRAGFSKGDIATVLEGIDFPAPLSLIALRGQRFGITRGSLTERLGGSP